MEENNWLVFVLEESLDDQTLFDQFSTLAVLSDKGDWHEHVLLIPNDSVNVIERFLTRHLLPSWFAHMISGQKIKILFKGEQFALTRGGSDAEVEEYALRHAVSTDDLDMEKLFKEAEKVEEQYGI